MRILPLLFLSLCLHLLIAILNSYFQFPALKPSKLLVFNALRSHSNANKKVMDTECTFMLISVMFVHAEPQVATRRPRRPPCWVSAPAHLSGRARSVACVDPEFVTSLRRSLCFSVFPFHALAHSLGKIPGVGVLSSAEDEVNVRLPTGPLELRFDSFGYFLTSLLRPSSSLQLDTS
jgi:hypothetical protein